MPATATPLWRITMFDFRNVIAVLVLVVVPTVILAQGVPRITTLAGAGKAGYDGDGGPADKALLKQPFHCEVDNKGTLYIAEAENHCIRKVDLKTGKIS